MKTASAMTGFDELKPYVPPLQREEKPITVVDGGNVNAEFYENDGEIGVMMMGPSGCEFVKGNAAFVFAESLENLYLRTDFSTVVKIDCDENNRQIFERLTKVKVASLSWWDGKVHKSASDIPVFHDEGEAKYFVQRAESAATGDDIGENLIRETPSFMLALPFPVCGRRRGNRRQKRSNRRAPQERNERPVQLRCRDCRPKVLRHNAFRTRGGVAWRGRASSWQSTTLVLRD